VIDFRYHLVSIVAVFLALAIGIVLGSTELQGNTIDNLRTVNSSLASEFRAAAAQRDSYGAQWDAAETFLQTAEPKLLDRLLPGDRVVLITEPGASSAVTGGIKQAVGLAGATITGTVALQPKFNDLSAPTEASLSTVNTQQAELDGTQLSAAADPATANQQQAAQLIATAILGRTQSEPGLSPAAATTLLQAYAQNGFLSYSDSPATRATLAVIAIPETPPADGAGDQANQILLAVAQVFATASAATIVVGSTAGSSQSASALSVLRSSSVSSQVSTVDNADTYVGQISAIWALADQVAGGKPGSYGISGASAISPQPPAVPSTSPSPTPSSTKPPAVKSTGKGKVDNSVKQR
jgi:hypothetical protein